MSEGLPVVTAPQVVSALLRGGFTFKRQRGSHRYFTKLGRKVFVCVPMHRGDITPGTLQNILKQAGLSVAELKELL